ncbi:PREDICTED: transcription repressor OFP15-like [Ipomoea nil]|uniref:transcription repressor OFP15-like n=1 Tax=Ipomoea nil TaxID=35883 RepID=UPI00090157EB|nr:PREDICTED: transcription repressor OFP15-like [Ipomoea nil]
MGKKMKLPFLFRSSEAWPPWPSCGFIGNPKTLSFRADGDSHSMLKTLNSAYVVDGCSSVSWGESPAAAAAAESFSSAPESFGDGGECVENVIRRLRSSERLFFEPGGARSSKLLEEEDRPPRVAAGGGGGGGESFVFKESVEMEIASRNPFADFRRSMAEMVEAHGGGFPQDWKFLEDLLACYLRINGKSSHGYIVGAFVDLLVELFMNQSLANEESDTINVASSSSSMASSSSSSSSLTSSINTYSHCQLSSSSSSSSSTTHSFTSPLSFCSSLSLLEEAEDETENPIDNASSSSSSSSSPHFS